MTRRGFFLKLLAAPVAAVVVTQFNPQMSIARFCRLVPKFKWIPGFTVAIRQRMICKAYGQ